jgi:putative nucleotidyltransferase with HDIG domain
VRELERSYDMTLEGFGDALALRDTETEGHSRRVAAFAIVIAKAMGLPLEQIPTIARGAFLHDIGKLAIPDAILCKPGKLTTEEMVIVKEHCFKGYLIVKKIPFLAEACEIVHFHHERYDGTGYPRGLKGEQILLGARIVAVANTLDSITSDLPYRPKQSHEAAREEIIRWSGRQFDPDVVKAFLEIPEDIWGRLRRDISSQAQRH